MPGPDPVWLYDSGCVLCSAAVAHTLRWERDPRIRFVAIQSREGRALAANHGIDPENPETFLFIEHGMAHPKLEGVIALARHLNGPGRMIIGLGILPRPARDWVYDRIARNRYRWFGKRESCLKPNAATRSRFVLPGE